MPVAAAAAAIRADISAGVGVRRAAGRMVQVVELGDRGIPRLEHLHLHEGGDGLDVVRGELLEEAVHEPPPGPEAVPAGRGRGAR